MIEFESQEVFFNDYFWLDCFSDVEFILRCSNFKETNSYMYMNMYTVFVK